MAIPEIKVNYLEQAFNLGVQYRTYFPDKSPEELREMLAKDFPDLATTALYQVDTAQQEVRDKELARVVWNSARNYKDIYGFAEDEIQFIYPSFTEWWAAFQANKKL